MLRMTGFLSVGHLLKSTLNLSVFNCLPLAIFDLLIAICSLYFMLLNSYRPANKAAGMESRDGDLDLGFSV